MPDTPDLMYAVVANEGDDTLRRFPHHKEGTDQHTHESVDVRLLNEALVGARSEAASTPDRILEMGIRHLEHHAESLGMSMLSDRADLKVSEASLYDQLRVICSDFEAKFEDMRWYDRPWIVDIDDEGFVVARKEDGRYYKYDYTEGEDGYTFSDPVQVKKVWQPVGTSKDDDNYEGADAPEADLLERIAHVVREAIGSGQILTEEKAKELFQFYVSSMEESNDDDNESSPVDGEPTGEGGTAEADHGSEGADGGDGVPADGAPAGDGV